MGAGERMTGPGGAGWLAAGCVLVVAPVAAAGAARPDLSAAAVALTACVVVAWLAVAGRRQGAALAGPEAWVLLAAAAVTLVQALPVGRDVASWLGGAAAGRIGDVLAAAGTERAWWAISADPAASLGEAARLAAWAGALALFTSIARDERRARVLMAVVAATGVAEAVVGIAHLAAGADSLFGLAGNEATVSGRFISTLLNRNHAAGLMNLGAFSALALAGTSGTDRGRGVARAAFAACAVGVLATLSRGGIVALGLGLLARVFLGRPRGEAEGGPVATSFGMRAVRTLVFVVAAGVAMVAVEDLLNQVAKSFVEPDQWARKAVTWAPTLDLVLDHPWLGAGRGAFAAVFRAYNDAEPGLVFHYVENLPLQALADWGLPLGIGLLLAGTAAGTDLLTRCRERPLALGGAVGVLAVVIQNLADFSMEIPGVAIPTLAVLGVAVASVRPAPGPGSRPGPGVRAAMLAAATALAIPGALWAARNGPETSGARMRDVATDATDARAGSGIDAPRAWERIRPEIAAHPHDVQLVAQASRILRAAGDRDGALALARAAALLAPSYRALALDRLDLELRRGVTPEAMAALASVFADHPKDRIELWERVRKAAPARELIEALAALPDHAALWDFVDDVERRAGPAAVRAVLAVATKKRPDDADLLERMGRNATKLRDWDAADRIAVRLLARHPGRPGGPLLLGRVFHASGQLLEALAMFEEAGRLDPRAPEPAIAAMQCLLAMKRFDEFDSAAERTRPLVVRDPSWGTHLHVLKAQRQEGRGAWQAALEELRQAERLAPGDPGVLLYEAGVLEKLDRAEEAALVLRRLLRVHPDNETAARALERLRAGEGR